MSEELKLNENVSAPQPDALARIARKDDFLQQLQEFLAQHKGENWCVCLLYTSREPLAKRESFPYCQSLPH